MGDAILDLDPMMLDRAKHRGLVVRSAAAAWKAVPSWFLALQLHIFSISESMGHHDSEVMDDGRIDRGDALARNAARKGFGVAIYNRHGDKTDELIANHGSEGRFIAAKTIPEFVGGARPSPRDDYPS
jgi:hypothetical protein